MLMNISTKFYACIWMCINIVTSCSSISNTGPDHKATKQAFMIQNYFGKLLNKSLI